MAIDTPSARHARASRAPGLARAFAFGALGTAALLAIYFATLTAVSGSAFALEQFATFWPYVAALATGFGIQVGLFSWLHRAVHAAHGSGKVVAASGTTSGVAMVSCCAHYLVNLLPALGAAGLVTFVAQYQIALFWVGLLANVLGIAYMGRRAAAFVREMGPAAR